MPLIIITGTPCSGKTYRAQQIFQDVKSRIDSLPNRSILYLPSHHASLDPPNEDSEVYTPPSQSQNPRDAIYDLARLEKTARAEEFSAIKRAINKNVVVIADAPNYIKGFRYQLFCEAKAVGTRSIVVHTAARQDECADWNNVRLKAWGWYNEATDDVTSPSSLSGPRIGKDVMGELDPESHTALYGDKVLNESSGARSRSSSTGAVDDDSDDEHRGYLNQQSADTMTLKSLYISEKQEATPSQSHTLGSIQEPSSRSSVPTPDLPPANPPHPKSSLPYSPTTLRSLFMRYEPPSPFTRWDTPLFTVPSTDSHPPYDQIWEAIFPTPTKSTSKKALVRERQEQERIQKEQSQLQNTLSAQKIDDDDNNVHTTALSVNPSSQAPTTAQLVTPVKPHAATVLPSATAPTALQTLETTTNELTKLILSAARAANVADGEDAAVLTITLPLPDEGPSAEELVLELETQEGVSVSQPKLQRLRRKFTQIQRGGLAHGQGVVVGRRGVAVEFVRFVEGEWRGEWEGMQG